MKKKEEESLLSSIIKGPSLGYTDIFPHRAMWKEIAKDCNGDFKAYLTSGNVFEIHRLTIPYKKWIITVSVSDTRPLKFNIEGVALENFELTLYWEDFLERIMKKLGSREYQIGNPDFDKHYLIRTNREKYVSRILTSDVQEGFLKYNIYSFSYETKREDEIAEIVSVISREVEDKETVLDLIKTFKTILDNLEELKFLG